MELVLDYQPSWLDRQGVLQHTYGWPLRPAGLQGAFPPWWLCRSKPALLHHPRCVPQNALCTYPRTRTSLLPFHLLPSVQIHPWVTMGSAPDDLRATAPHTKHHKATLRGSWGPSRLKPNWSDICVWVFIDFHGVFIYFHSVFQAIVVLCFISLTDIQILKWYIKIYICDVLWGVWVNKKQITELWLEGWRCYL